MIFILQAGIKLHYLCYFISGVPFNSEKDLGKDFRDVHAVVPGQEWTNYSVLHLSLSLYIYIQSENKIVLPRVFKSI